MFSQHATNIERHVLGCSQTPTIFFWYSAYRLLSVLVDGTAGNRKPIEQCEKILENHGHWLIKNMFKNELYNFQTKLHKFMGRPGTWIYWTKLKVFQLFTILKFKLIN